MTSSSRAAPPARRYTLKFVPAALAEWGALDGSVKANLKKLLAKRLDNPHVPGSELRGELRGCYKTWTGGFRWASFALKLLLPIRPIGRCSRFRPWLGSIPVPCICAFRSTWRSSSV